MKKEKYHFSNLIHFGLLEEDDKQLVFQQSKAIMRRDSYTYFPDLIELITQSFSELEELYIMHDFQLRKGKINKLLGNIALTNKTNLISFLEFEMEHNDLRTFRILKSKDAVLSSK